MGRLPARPGTGETAFVRGALAAVALVCAPPATASVGNVYIADTTVAFEDTTTTPDEDVNDVTLRYNARCRLVGDGTLLAHHEIGFTPVAAGALLVNELWLALPATPSRVTLAVGADAPVTLCSGDCSASVQLLADFEQAFVGSAVEFVNTTDGPTVPAPEHVVYVEYEALPDLGAATCPPADFQVRRSDVVIDGTTTQPGSGMPLRGAFPGDWDVPRERTRVSVAYADFLEWLDAVVGGCEPGSCPAEDWYERPDPGFVVDRADLAATAPLTPPATCSDGLANQDETDLDCGGALCGPCTVDEACAVDLDCDTGVCEGGVCAAPSCTDGVANGDETGLDCGGASCAPCGVGEACATGDDCLTGACGVGLDGTCGAPLCFDGAPAASGAFVTCSVEDGVPYQIQRFATAGNRSFTAPAGVWQVEALVVGGGGGAGGSAHGLGGGGGGGGGGLAWFVRDVVPGTAYALTIGGGGTGGTGAPGNGGGASSFLGVTVSGGGGGGSGNTGGYATQGGSGGGAGYNGYNARVGAYGIPGQGHAGGANQCSNYSAGGGGAGGPGGNQGSYTNCGSGYGRAVEGGLGGAGVLSDISGALIEYARGGNGTIGSTDGQAGAAGTGNGGHGTYANANGGKGGNGGSGTAILRFVSAATCDNGVVDGDETDIDCGGTCGPCANGEACRDVEDCASGYCGVGLDGTCGTATCFDGAPLASGAVRTCTDDGLAAWEVHTYTATGTKSFTPPVGVTSVEVLVVAGGGGGGGSAPSSGGGGGGGAGGLKYVTGVAVSPGTPVTVTVGAGGPGGSGGAGGTGGSSSFGAIGTTGGGGGGSGVNGAAATTGGSGGGAGYNGYNTASGAAGTSGQGNAGGNNRCSNVAAGGGGAGGPGQHQGDFIDCGVGYGRSVMGGLGGPGAVFDLTGFVRTYAEGGDGAGASVDYAAGVAGTGNGGNGSYGGNNGGKGGAGGSGTVIVRFPAP